MRNFDRETGVKRDMELFRAILLKIEDEGSSALRHVPELPGHEHQEVVEHVRMGIEAGFFEAIDATTLKARDYMQIRLTWRGHEFLEKVRDPEIWRQTKSAAAKIGNRSIAVLGELAVGFVKAKAASLGLPLA